MNDQEYLYLLFGIIVVLLIAFTWLLLNFESVKVYRFTNPACNACIASQSEWDKFASSCYFKLIKPIEIDTLKLESAKLMNNFGVKSTPTIYKLYPDGRRFLYSGDRSSEDLLNFSKKEEM